MREEKQKIISYLLNDDVDVQDRISICNQLTDKFPTSSGDYEAVPHIRESLEKYDESPSLDLLDDVCDQDYSSFEKKEVSKRSDVLKYMDEDWRNFIGTDLLQRMRVEIEKDDKDPQEFITEVKETLNEFDEKLPTGEDKSFMELYEERKQMGEGVKPYNSVVEDCIEEYPKGTISVLAGAQGHMKTTVALHELRKNVFNGKNIVYLSLEMPEDLILGRIYSAYSFRPEFKGEPFYGMEEKDFVNANLTEEQEEGLEEVIIPAVHGKGGNFEVLTKDDIESFRTSGLRSTFSKLDFKPDGIFIDHIHEFKEGDIPKNTYNDYAGNWLVSRLTELEKDVDGRGTPVHIRVLSQVTKEGQRDARETDGAYHQSDIRSLSDLEDSASFIMFLYAPQSMLNSEMCNMHITKNRFGKQTEDPEDFDVLPGQGRVAEGRNFAGTDGESIQDMDKEKQKEAFERDKEVETDISF